MFCTAEIACCVKLIEAVTAGDPDPQSYSTKQNLQIMYDTDQNKVDKTVL
jgi:hypothetical protein